MNMMIFGVLACCSPLCIVTMAPVTNSKNLSCPAPNVGDSQEDMRLPFYTSGFE